MITTVAELTTAALAWVNRENDTVLAARVPDFIALTEADLRRELRVSIAASDLTINAAKVAKPAGVAELRNIRLTSGDTVNNWEILPRTVSQLNELRRRFPVGGIPRYFAEVGEQLWFVPAPDESYTAEMVYQSTYVPLATSTALLVTAPDLYLYGVLAHMAPYLEHDERAPIWGELYNAAREALNLQREREEFGLLNRQPQRLPRVFGRRP
jgi:hypothetical protein